MDCGCTSTCIFSAGTPNSHFASITSKPLFIMLAESMVIFAPMSQLGCFSASAAVTCAICSRVNRRKGPPLAVSRIFSISLWLSPANDWKIAECSLSTGKMGTRCSCARRQMISPATTSVSLFASAMVLPAFIASIVGRKPA